MDSSEEKGIKLQLFMAKAGVASRRKCESLIQEGKVKVNGVLVTKLGGRVNPSDKVEYLGETLTIKKVFYYYLLNKPSKYLCAASDDRGRPLALSLLPVIEGVRLYSVGRLDYLTSGALLFTNDGVFTKCFTHPSFEIEKEYIVNTYEIVPKEFASIAEKGVRIEEVFYKCAKVTEINRRCLSIVLTEGKNKEVRRLLQHFNLHVEKLKRVRIGEIELGSLPLGNCRTLTDKELDWASSIKKKSLQER